MATARRIIFSTYVIPTQSIEAEETSVRHTEFQASPNGTLGGKGTAIINATQWGDGWTSFSHPNVYWEDQEGYGDVWELQGETWSGTLSISDAVLTSLAADSGDLAFLYIKNTGDTNNCAVSLNGQMGNYYLIIPPNGSINLRGDGTNLDCNDVYVTSSNDSTTIEYLVAKE